MSSPWEALAAAWRQLQTTCEGDGEDHLPSPQIRFPAVDLCTDSEALAGILQRLDQLQQTLTGAFLQHPERGAEANRLLLQFEQLRRCVNRRLDQLLQWSHASHHDFSHDEGAVGGLASLLQQQHQHQLQHHPLQNQQSHPNFSVSSGFGNYGDSSLEYDDGLFAAQTHQMHGAMHDDSMELPEEGDEVPGSLLGGLCSGSADFPSNHDHRSHHQQQQQQQQQPQPWGSRERHSDPEERKERPEKQEEHQSAGPPAWTPRPGLERDPRLRYRLVRSLRDTLQGQVLLCQDLGTGRRVAVKLSRRALALRGVSQSGNPVVEDIVEERKLMQLLAGAAEADRRRLGLAEAAEHPSDFLVSLVDLHETADELWTVLEFCTGGELFDVVSMRGRVDDGQARTWFLQLMRGVAWLHGLGLCHLDLSLENMLLDDRGRVKICDFGVARRLVPAPAGSPRHWELFPAPGSTRPGKLQYMAPEVFTGQQPFDGILADVFSCGLILAIMLLSVPPFETPSVSDGRFRWVVEGRLGDLLASWKMDRIVSPEAIDLISKMLCYEDRRWTVEQVLAHPWCQKK